MGSSPDAVRVGSPPALVSEPNRPTWVCKCLARNSPPLDLSQKAAKRWISVVRSLKSNPEGFCWGVDGHLCTEGEIRILPPQNKTQPSLAISFVNVAFSFHGLLLMG